MSGTAAEEYCKRHPRLQHLQEKYAALCLHCDIRVKRGAASPFSSEHPAFHNVSLQLFSVKAWYPQGRDLCLQRDGMPLICRHMSHYKL